MATDRVTKEQRRSIFDSGRKIEGQKEFRHGVNHVASYLSEHVGQISLYALGAVLDTYDHEPPFGTHFNAVNWEALGASTLEDLQVLSDDELAATYRDAELGVAFTEAVRSALAVFNLRD